jgi:hypothetical protein
MPGDAWCPSHGNAELIYHGRFVPTEVDHPVEKAQVEHIRPTGPTLGYDLAPRVGRGCPHDVVRKAIGRRSFDVVVRAGTDSCGDRALHQRAGGGSRACRRDPHADPDPGSKCYHHHSGDERSYPKAPSSLRGGEWRALGTRWRTRWPARWNAIRSPPVSRPCRRSPTGPSRPCRRSPTGPSRSWRRSPTGPSRLCRLCCLSGPSTHGLTYGHFGFVHLVARSLIAGLLALVGLIAHRSERRRLATAGGRGHRSVRWSWGAQRLRRTQIERGSAQALDDHGHSLPTAHAH